MICTYQIDNNYIKSDTINKFITDAAYTNHFTHHTVLRFMPTVSIFGRDLLLKIPYVTDCKLIGQCRHSKVDKYNKHEKKQWIDYYHEEGLKFFIKKYGVLCKAK